MPGAIQISNWFANRKKEKQQMEEEAVMMITDNMSENETTIMDTLMAVDFIHSDIPKEILEQKSKPRQPCGDLELSRNFLIKIIRNNPADGTVDLRNIDTSLIKLAEYFRSAVQHGQVDTALAAKAALYIGLKDIRIRASQENPEILDTFIAVHCKYLESWITLVDMCQAIDQEKKNMRRLAKIAADQKAKNDAQKDQFEEMLKNDPKAMQIFLDLINNDVSGASRAAWTAQERSIHTQMVQMRFAEGQTELITYELDQGQKEIAAREAKKNVLHTKLSRIPIVSDPNLMNKFKADVDDLFMEMARTDVEIDETLQFMDEIEGRIAAFENASGNQRTREVVHEQAGIFLEGLAEKQRDKVLN